MPDIAYSYPVVRFRHPLTNRLITGYLKQIIHYAGRPVMYVVLTRDETLILSVMENDVQILGED